MVLPAAIASILTLLSYAACVPTFRKGRHRICLRLILSIARCWQYQCMIENSEDPARVENRTWHYARRGTGHNLNKHLKACNRQTPRTSWYSYQNIRVLLMPVSMPKSSGQVCAKSFLKTPRSGGYPFKFREPVARPQVHILPRSILDHLSCTSSRLAAHGSTKIDVCPGARIKDHQSERSANACQLTEPKSEPVN